ncbi:hypothetical protein [Mogibacterium kristiansenii]|uniref:hypothetical protein n=1 Tax=Mogibacterium kristiansenii TaxID=2606708 RepID=UPI0012B360E2|nr:hypothetical protein [Mogibacterium kristiansenii]
MKTKMKKMMMLALDEAVAMYQELMEQENQIFAKNKKLWASRLWAVSHPTNRKKRRTT